MKTKTNLFLVVLLAVALAACAGPSNDGPNDVPIPVEPDGGIGDGAPGPLFIDSADVLVMESYPVQVSMVVSGNLPDPCHGYTYAYQIDWETQLVNIDLLSTLPDPSVSCVQVLEPFEANIALDLDGIPDGEYDVYLNGELIGSFAYPG